MTEICGDNRFEIITKAKAHLLNATNIDTSPKEMEVLDTFLYRCWQMGWLDRYAEHDKPQTSGVVWTEDAIKNEPKSYTTWASSDELQMDCKDCKYAWWNGEKYECPFKECRYSQTERGK